MINPQARLDPKILEQWSDAAVRLYIDKKIPLSKAVYEIVKDQDLTIEHLKLVLRGANVKAYLEEYNRLPSENRYVTFDGGLAKLEEIIDMLENEEPIKVSVFKDSLLDYATPPEDFKIKKLARSLESIPEKKQEKIDLNSLYLLTKAAKDKVASHLTSLANKKDEILGNFVYLVKTALKEGYSIGDVIRAASDSPSRDLSVLVIKVAKELPDKFWTDTEILQSLEKRSSLKVDITNPIRKAWDKLQECIKEAATKEKAFIYLEAKEKEILQKLGEKK